MVETDFQIKVMFIPIIVSIYNIYSCLFKTQITHFLLWNRELDVYQNVDAALSIHWK